MGDADGWDSTLTTRPKVQMIPDETLFEYADSDETGFSGLTDILGGCVAVVMLDGA